jgi:tetratricopeptide (TPR) repeat protein
VAEEAEGPEHGATTGAGVDPAALSIALGGASRAKADAFLDKQSLIADLQIARMRAQDDHIEEEQRLQLSHLRVRRFSDYSKMALEIAVGIFLMAVVGGLGVMVWNAAHDHDLVIDAFIVPPDMAARGVTGQVVAAELLGQFAQMQAATPSSGQAAASSRNASVDGIRIAIPETGVSIGELDRYLRGWLGSETHVSGAVVRTAIGLTITVRYGSSAGDEMQGAETDFKKLIQKAAESLYGQALPQRYADYLVGQGRFDEALAVLEPRAAVGSPSERAVTLTSWAELLLSRGEPAAALPLAQSAARLAPRTANVHWALADINDTMDHEQAESEQDALGSQYGRELETSDDTYLRKIWCWYQAMGDWRTGDLQAANNDWDIFLANGGTGTDIDGYASYFKAITLFGAHDLGAARDIAAEIPSKLQYWPANFHQMLAQEWGSASVGDWRSVVRLGRQLGALAPGKKFVQATALNWVVPQQAIGLAHLGDIAGAEALIATTALDCDLCVGARGQIAAIRHDSHAVDRWFGMVAKRSPSIPSADTEWGAALRMKGDLDGAILKFQEANAISSHFADPLEMWGEALMAKNRSDLALAKFAEADNYAPNWGRLHLKWGEALIYAGKPDDAKKQFAIAASLDLTHRDKSTLTAMRAAHG